YPSCTPLHQPPNQTYFPTRRSSDLFNNIVAISRKIHSADERKRLQRIVESIKPKNFGVIVRTAAEGKDTAELHADLLELSNVWRSEEHTSELQSRENSVCRRLLDRK